jgi:hypothetical protein
MNRNPLSMAELQYKLALSISALAATNGPITGQLEAFTWGRQRLEAPELELSPREEQLAASLLEHSAIYLMMQQLDKELDHKHGGGRFKPTAGDLRPVAWIARLLRNAFAHDPMFPVWLIERSVRNTLLEVPGTIRIDTTDLGGKPVRPRHYGGPIAVLRLLQAAREHFLTFE